MKTLREPVITALIIPFPSSPVNIYLPFINRAKGIV